MESYEKVVAVSFVMSLVLSALLIWFVIEYQRKIFRYENEKKDALLREQALKIEKQEAIEHERTRIAGEMHDDLGSGLTVIKYLCDGIHHKTEDPDVKANLTKITEYSEVLVRNMSEIIWAMNSRFDNFGGLISYIRRYVLEYLEDHGMENNFVVEDCEESWPISGEKRRNIYLVVKEILHNSVKYSKASCIRICINTVNKFEMTIDEVDGVGFDADKIAENGNGIYNIQKRMDKIGGSIHFLRTSQNMKFIINLPMYDQPDN